MGIREQARAETAPAIGAQPQEPHELARLKESIDRQHARHGVPDSAVYDPANGRAVGEPVEPEGRIIGQEPAGRELEPTRRELAVRADGPLAPRLVMGTPLQLTEQQYRVLLAPINRARVGTKQGQSHLEAWDVRRYLTKIFGFGGWNVQTLSTTKLYEKITAPGEGKVTRWIQGNKQKVANEDFMFTVVYEAQVRLTIYNPDGTVGAFYEDAATGDGANMPTYQQAADFAIKTALSQALKRCAVNLGDQFGLSLYNKGSVNAQVELTLRPPTWEGLPPANDEIVRKATENEQVHGEEQPAEEGAEPAPVEDPGEQDDADPSTGLPDVKALRDEACERRTPAARLSAIYAMVHRKKGTQPELGSMIVINETGDEEALDALVYRQIQERRREGEIA
jgi:hypothetical protein